jgi:hypothetical protein
MSPFSKNQNARTKFDPKTIRNKELFSSAALHFRTDRSEPCVCKPWNIVAKLKSFSKLLMEMNSGHQEHLLLEQKAFGQKHLTRPCPFHLGVLFHTVLQYICLTLTPLSSTPGSSSILGVSALTVYIAAVI